MPSLPGAGLFTLSAALTARDLGAATLLFTGHRPETLPRKDLLTFVAAFTGAATATAWLRVAVAMSANWGQARGT